MSAKEMRGLTVFITDLRGATTKEQEKARITKELTHIRDKFTNTKDLSDYDKKKYMWKLVYIYLQGYDVDFGHMVCIGMIGSRNYSVKQVGYVACSVLLSENTDLMRLTIQSIKGDMALNAPDSHQALALSFVANNATTEVAEGLWDDACRLLFSKTTKVIIRKKAALCLLRMIRRNPDVLSSEHRFSKEVSALLADTNVGVLIAVSSLVLGIVAQASATADLENNPSIAPIMLYKDVPARCTEILSKICFNGTASRSVYKYYNTICPWLQVKLLKILQYFPAPEDQNVQRVLTQLLNDILTRTVITKNANKNNADYSIFFEAVHLVFHYSRRSPHPCLDTATGNVLKFVNIKEPNFKYVALDCMIKLATLPHALAGIRAQKNSFASSVRDPDVSIRKRALDLLYVTCDVSSAKMVVGELLSLLETESYGLREELVLKIVVLAEQFAPELNWYVDVVMRLIEIAGAFVSDDVWFRIVQVASNAEELQEYSVRRALIALESPTLHDSGVKLCGYILGEFSYRLSDDSVDPKRMFTLLMHHYHRTDYSTRAVLLTAFCKMANTFSELKNDVLDVFKRSGRSIDTEVQQRASEYYHLAELDEDLVATVLDVMPEWQERDNVLVKLLRRAQHSSADRDIWAAAADEADAAMLGDVDSITTSPTTTTTGNSASSSKSPTPPKGPPPSGPSGGVGSVATSSSSAKSAARAQATEAAAEVADRAFRNTNAVEDDFDNLFNPPQNFGPQALSLVHTALNGTSPQGIIYSSSALEVQCRAQPDPSSAYTVKMILMISNKSDHAIKSFAAEVDVIEDVPGAVSLRAQVKTSATGDIASHSTEKVFILWNVIRPFTVSPKIKFRFSWEGDAPTNGKNDAVPSPTDDIFGFLDAGLAPASAAPIFPVHDLSLVLPLTLLHFCTPNPVNEQVRSNSWGEYTKKAPAETFVRPNTSGHWNQQTIQQQLEERHKLSYVSSTPGSSSELVNLNFSGTFNSGAKSANGENVTIPLLVTVTIAARADMAKRNNITFLVSALHPSVSSAMISAIKSTFSQP